MGGFKWYPGARARLDAAFRESVAQAAGDALDDLVGSGTLPYDSDGDGSHVPGTLQASTVLDDSESRKGVTRIVSDTDYAAKLYFHPEYEFDEGENAGARGLWFHQYFPRGAKRDLIPASAARHLKERLGS